MIALTKNAFVTELQAIVASLTVGDSSHDRAFALLLNTTDRWHHAALQPDSGTARGLQKRFGLSVAELQTLKQQLLAAKGELSRGKGGSATIRLREALSILRPSVKHT